EEQDLILDRLREDRFLSEKRFAESFTRGKFRSNRWGKLKIRYALAQKGISDQDIRHGLKEIPDEEYEEGLRYILNQKIDRLKPELSKLEKRQRLYAFAQQKGYEMDWIKRTIKDLDKQL
ncbi:MAG: regulatory protein RecX, partial [Bacteroidota bacterium]